MKVLVTGAAGFIGFHVSKCLLARGDDLIGLDNLNDYYDVSLKEARLEQLANEPGFRFHRLDVADRTGMAGLFARERPDAVVHLAAQAGVRHSLRNPHAYVDANLVGFVNILEGCRQAGTRHLVFASSSSVYGANTRVPFSEHDEVNHPLSLYAATKKANELLAHSYSHLYGLPVTGLRFFTVYGPWGRPDMSYFLFARALVEGRPIEVFNYGKMERDFTYIDDVVEGVARVLDQPAQADPGWRPDTPDPAASAAPYRIYNIGNHCPVPLLRFIAVLEQCFGRTVEKKLLPPQPGDVAVTCADMTALTKAIGFTPHTPIAEGLARFAHWFLHYYGLQRKAEAVMTI